MKKIALLLLIAVILAFGACGAADKESDIKEESESVISTADEAADSDVLRICLDIDHGVPEALTGGTVTYELENAFAQALKLENVEFEYIPKYGAERDGMIDRIRVELMSGDGPDVFIIKCHDLANREMSEPLFTMPEKVMNSGYFLPLDKYIENETEYTDWEKLTQPVLEAGKNEEGQQIIPLTYTLPVLYFKRTNGVTVDKTMKLDEMLSDAELSNAAKQLLSQSYDYSAYGDDAARYSGSNELCYIFGDAADYDDEELLITEEELNAELDRIFKITDELYESGSYMYGVKTGLAPLMMMDAPQQPDYEEGMEYDLISLCSVDGGYSAAVMSYAAVNRNTDMPESAYAVVDFLLRRDAQQKYMLYTEVLHRGAFPINEELFSTDYPAGKLKTALSENAFSEVCELRSAITNVHFADEIDSSLSRMIFQYTSALQSGEDAEAVVANTYRELQQLLGE